MEQSRCRRATSKQAIIIHLQDICHSQHNLHPQTALRCLVRIADNRCKQLSRCFIHTHLHFAFFSSFLSTYPFFHFLSSPPQLLSFSFFLNFLCSHFLVSFTFPPSPLSSSSLPNLLLSLIILSNFFLLLASCFCSILSFLHLLPPFLCFVILSFSFNFPFSPCLSPFVFSSDVHVFSFLSFFLSFHVLSFQQLSQFLTYFPFFFLLLWLSHPFIPPFSFFSYFFFSPSFLPPSFPFPLISSFLCFHILFLFYFYLAFLV